MLMTSDYSGRWYCIKNKWYPSVTTILNTYPKPELNYWLAKVGIDKANEISSRTAESGTKVHNAINHMIENPLSKLDINMWTIKEQHMINGFFQFMETYNAKILMTEMSMGSEKLNCAGTLDLIIEIPKKVGKIYPGIYVTDIKTTNNLYRTHEIQGVVYKHMYFENKGYPSKFKKKYDDGYKSALLWLKKDAKKKFFQFKEIPETCELDTFTACHYLWDDQYGYPTQPKLRNDCKLAPVSLNKFKDSISIPKTIPRAKLIKKDNSE